MTFRGQAWQEKTRLGLMQTLGASLLGNSSSSSLARLGSVWFGSTRAVGRRQGHYSSIIVSECVGDRGAQLSCFPCVPSSCRSVSYVFCASWTYRRGYHGLVWSGLVSGLVCLVYLGPGLFAFFFPRERRREKRSAAGGAAKMVKRRQEGKDGKKEARGKQEKGGRDAVCVCVCYRTVPSYPFIPIPVAFIPCMV
jgi:hypothetical protein